MDLKIQNSSNRVALPFTESIDSFTPITDEEKVIKNEVMLLISEYGEKLSYRECLYHITPSALIVNRGLSKVLLIKHKIRGNWQWTGGHLDGSFDLEEVAMKEATEETGITNLTFLSKDVQSLDIFKVEEHLRRGELVTKHYHITPGYVLMADEGEILIENLSESEGIRWFNISELSNILPEKERRLYDNLIAKAKKLTKSIR